MTHLRINGLDRSYRLFVPETLPDGPRPLVFVFHGGGGTGEIIARVTGFDACAARHGFIACYPDGIDRHWNDGRGIQSRRATREAVDDSAFVLALTDYVGENYPVDAARMYLAGASNGAFFCWRMAFEHPERFAAVAGVMAPLHLPYARETQPRGPMPVLMMHGTADPIVPYDGGIVTLQREELGEVMSVRDSAAFWCALNQCGALPQETLIADVDGANTMRVWRELYNGGTIGAELMVYSIDGGGHTWPGGEQYAPEWLIGPTCRAFSATEHIWAFFERHERRSP